MILELLSELAYVQRRSEMNTQAGGCLIVCSWQPGATHKTFNWERFEREVCIPLLDAFITPESFVCRALIVTRCAKAGEHGDDVEVGEWTILPGEGVPAHILTPTSTAVLRNLKTWVEKGKVLWLNVDSKNDDDAINQAVIFARNQGCHSVIIPHGVPIPDDVVRLGILLKKAQETGLALRYSVPCLRTADLIDA